VKVRLARATAWANRHQAGIESAFETYAEWTMAKAMAPLIVPMLIWEYVKDDEKEEGND
jgi:hypothetical protein